MNRELKIKKFILIVMSISLILAGGYYEYISALLSAIIMFGIVYFGNKDNQNNKDKKVIKNLSQKSDVLDINSAIIFSGVLLIFYAISCIYATDSGMAFTGVVKKAVIFIFSVFILFIDKQQRKALLGFLPHMASGVCLLGCFGICIMQLWTHIFGTSRICNAMIGFIIKNHRFSGTFGYANTFAVFMLIGIIVAILNFNKKNIVNIIETIIMFDGLWFSASRFTLILFMLIMMLLLLHMGSNKIRATVAGIVAFMVVILGVLFRNTGIAGRIFSDNLSTLYGRFLYWQDAITLIKRHPFGMGYLGYYYEQTEIQTGVYTVRYVHNDILQMVLDIGIIPVFIIVAIIIFALLNKERTYLEKILIFTIIAHCIFEFDFEYTAIMFIFVLVLSCSEEKIYASFIIQANTLKYVGIICGVFSLYMAVPLSFYAMGNNDAALKLYPIYTDASISKLSKTQDMDEGRKLANQILRQNDTVSIAYSALAQVACQEEKTKKLAKYEKKAIERNKFDREQYMEYLSLLNDLLRTEKVMNSPKLTNIVIKNIKEVPKMIEKHKKTVSPLGKKINDKVDIELDKELLKEINGL